MKIIVTGADGFIGRYIAKKLCEKGNEVYAVVMAEAVARGIIGECANLTYIECNMNDYGALAERNELCNADLLFHFAWAGVSDAYSADYNFQLNNVRCSCVLQETASKLGVKRMVFADSIMEFEHKKALENGIYELPLRNTYHIAKNAAYQLLSLRCNECGMDFISVLISNVYGVGENSPRLINTAIRKFIRREHMGFTSGEQMYDFIYIDDAVEAIITAAEKGCKNRQYYIGSESPRPLKEYLGIIRERIAPDMELGLNEREFHGVSLTYNEFDTKALYEELGFRSKYSFEQGIDLTAKWIAQTENNG